MAEDKKYNPNLEDNLIVNLSFQFALQVIDFTEILESHRKFAIANQLIRCGSSIGANVREAQNAESKADFVHKMKVAAKEAEETEYWLLLAHHSKNYPSCEELIDKLIVIKKVLSKIIGTSKGK